MVTRRKGEVGSWLRLGLELLGPVVRADAGLIENEAFGSDFIETWLSLILLPQMPGDLTGIGGLQV